MGSIVLRQNPIPEDDQWSFNLTLPRSRQGMGKHISFSPEKITFDMIKLPQNRILQADQAEKFVLVSFEKLRFPERPAREATEYMIRFFKAGLHLNGIQYRFYHHSNSQLVCLWSLSFSRADQCPKRSRSCFMREATTDRELDDLIYRLGNFQGIPNAAKRTYAPDPPNNHYSLTSSIPQELSGLGFFSQKPRSTGCWIPT